MRIKNFVLIISIIFFVSFTGVVLAQTYSVTTSTSTISSTTALTPTTTSTTASTAEVSGEGTSTEQEAETMIDKDENVDLSDLGAGEPALLPGNPFYFLKNWGHWIRSIFVFNRVKKADLMQKYTSEKLLEARRLLEKKNKNPQLIDEVINNYNKSLSRLQSYVDKIENSSSSQADNFMDKFFHQQMLHQKILDKLETKVPTTTFQKIEEARKRHLEMFKSIMLKLQNKQQIEKRLEKSFKKEKGSPFRGIKELEILNRLKSTLPSPAKHSIERAQQTIIDKLQENLKKTPPSKRGLLKDYLNKLPGDPEEHINILQDVTTFPGLRQTRDRALEKMSERIEKAAQKKGCPALEKPEPGFCRGGRIVLKRDNNGCPVSFECVSLPKVPFQGEYQKQCLFVCLRSSLSQISTSSAATSTIRRCLSAPLVSPRSTESFKDCLSPIVNSSMVDKCLAKCTHFREHRYCPTLWDPVCGENGLTYPNSCLAELAGVKIAHQGKCEIHEVEIHKMDNTRREVKEGSSENANGTSSKKRNPFSFHHPNK